MWYLLAVFFAGMLNIVGKQTPDNITSNAMAQYQMITVGFFCLTPFKSHCQLVLKTPLTLMKAIILAHLVGVQSFRIFKI